MYVIDLFFLILLSLSWGRPDRSQLACPFLPRDLMGSICALTSPDRTWKMNSITHNQPITAIPFSPPCTRNSVQENIADDVFFTYTLADKRLSPDRAFLCSCDLDYFRDGPAIERMYSIVHHYQDSATLPRIMINGHSSPRDKVVLGPRSKTCDCLT